MGLRIMTLTSSIQRKAWHGGVFASPHN